MDTEHDEDLFAWLRYKSYIPPTWVKETEKKPNISTFADYWIVKVRTRYMELENEFVINALPLINKETSEADRIQYSHTSFLLKQAREELEKEKPEPVMATVLLDQVERYLVWTYEPSALDAKIDTFYNQLEESKLPEKARIVARIEKAREVCQDIQNKKNLDAAEPWENNTAEVDKRLKINEDDANYNLEAVMDESINLLTRSNLQEFINDQLQNRRLDSLIVGGAVLLILLLLISPLALNITNITGWPSTDLSFMPLAAIYLNAIVISMMGAGGAFLSGLLQVRSSHITFSAYHESLKKLALRPLVGAIISLVFFVLLSWGVIPGFTAQTPGSYMFLAFLAGFSERFFLQIIKTESGEGNSKESGPGQLTGPYSSSGTKPVSE